MFVETGRRWIAFLANNVVGKNGWWLVAPGQYDTRGGKVVSSTLSRKEKKRADTTPSSRSSAQNITMHEFLLRSFTCVLPFLVTERTSTTVVCDFPNYSFISVFSHFSAVMANFTYTQFSFD